MCLNGIIENREDEQEDGWLVASTQVEHSILLTELTAVEECLYWLLQRCFDIL